MSLQKISARIAIIALLSIQQTAIACTGIMLKTVDKAILHGRTLEFGIPIETSIVVTPRGYVFKGQTPKGSGLNYVSKYAAVGAIAFKDDKILDGLNEKGLAVGAFYFPGYASYSKVTPENQLLGLSPGDFPNWILTQFSSVDEVKAAIKNKEVIITPTVMPGWGPEAPPFHYVVYDKSGKSIVIEPINGQLVVHNNSLGVITNSPTFDWHMTNLSNYISLNPLNVPKIEMDGSVFKQLGQGNGMIGLPGDFTPPSRFIRAAIFSATAIPPKNVETGVTQVFHILNNFDIPIGVAREKVDGVVHTDYTLLTAVRDPQNLKYYYKSYDDQTIRMVNLNQFDLNSKGIKRLSTKSEQQFVNMSEKLHL